VELHNLYGPTEASVDVTYWKCERDFQGTVVPIGRPVANTQIYILDEAMRPVGLEDGELHIGGVQLARGYLGRPVLTSEKFVADPFSNDPNARLYKTGDLARFQSDGNIIYLGRLDHQVKLRGFRIELGEIENALSAHPSVKQSVVVAREDQAGDKRLVAYVIPRDGKRDIALDAFLKDKLPDYMVPSAFVFLEAFPLSANGKLDRKALPAPREIDRRQNDPAVPARSEMELGIAGIWSAVLGIENVGINESFFDAGGNSLKLVMVQTKLREQLKIDVPVATLFEHPTIASFAEYLGRGGETNSSAQDRARKQREALARRREVQRAQ
jgi:acyl carrier protein